MFSKSYRLDSNGSFVFRFTSCTGVMYGFGSYVQTRRELVFAYDSVVEPYYVSKHDTSIGNNVRIVFKHRIDEEAISKLLVYYGDTFYITDTSGEVLIEYSGG
ncbi:MAG: hypothetical protein GC181_07130 [Bacteroidetes bacterium]|nr:hypothetical protein [Bacteroidota bacterium]